MDWWSSHRLDYTFGDLVILLLVLALLSDDSDNFLEFIFESKQTMVIDVNSDGIEFAGLNNFLDFWPILINHGLYIQFTRLADVGEGILTALNTSFQPFKLCN